MSYRGSIVVVPADEKMRTELGIQTFGPKYFGYKEDYNSVEKLSQQRLSNKTISVLMLRGVRMFWDTPIYINHTELM